MYTNKPILNDAQYNSIMNNTIQDISHKFASYCRANTVSGTYFGSHEQFLTSITTEERVVLLHYKVTRHTYGNRVTLLSFSRILQEQIYEMDNILLGEGV